MPVFCLLIFSDGAMVGYLKIEGCAKKLGVDRKMAEVGQGSRMVRRQGWLMPPK